MHLDSEMTVLSATGVSDRRILWYTQGPALVTALFVAWLSIWVGASESPRGR